MKPSILMVLTPAFAEAKAFYRDVLGLRMASELSDIAIFALDGGAELHLFECAAPAPNAPHGEAGATVLVFEVEDLDARMAELKGRGVTFIHQTPAANALFRYAAFTAPGGVVHELAERIRN
jgi:glyoxylase I family protein